MADSTRQTAAAYPLLLQMEIMPSLSLQVHVALLLSTMVTVTLFCRAYSIHSPRGLDIGQPSPLYLFMPTCFCGQLMLQYHYVMTFTLREREEIGSMQQARYRAASKNSPVPMHYQVERDMRERIESGVW